MSKKKGKTKFGNPYDNQERPVSKTGASGSVGVKKNKSGGTSSKKRTGGESGYQRHNDGAGSGGGTHESGGLGMASLGAASGLPGVTQGLTCLSAFMVLIVGIIHMVELFEDLEQCDEDDATDDEIECIGQSLFWKNFGKDDSHSSNLNLHWRRGAFSFIPALFVDNWTPLVLGLLACFQLFVDTRWRVISGNWLRATFFHAIMALFGCFPYSGQVGVIFGFFVSFTGLLCVLCFATGSGGPVYWTFR